MKRNFFLIALLFSFYISINIFSQENVPFESIPQLGHPSQNLDGTPPMPIPSEEKLEFPTSKSAQTKEEKETISKVNEAWSEDSNVYLDFKDADIKEVARILSKISGVSILVSEDVKANVTLNIEGVNWKKALELILETYNLAAIEKEGFIILVTYKQIQDQQNQVPLETKIVTLNFVDISEANEYLKAVMTSRGNLSSDKRTNSLIVTDIPDVVDKVEEIVKQLDRKTPQVLISVLMADKKCTDDLDSGIDWTFSDKNASERMIRQTLSLTGDTSATITYGKSIFSHAQFTATLNAWKQNKKVDIIANPKILTLDNITAEINITEQIPYTQQTESTDGGSVTSTQFKDVGVTVNVKPHITEDKHIIMDIETNQSFRSGYTPDSQPIIDSRTSKTTMMIRDNETIVIGGLRKKENSATIDKVPILGDIPFLGNAFKRKVLEDSQQELLIFVTPTIVKDSPLSLQEIEKKEKADAKVKQHEQEVAEEALNALPTKTKAEIKERLNILYKQALLLYNNEQLDNAEIIFKKIVSLDPEQIKAKQYLKKLIPQKREETQIKKQREEQESLARNLLKSENQKQISKNEQQASPLYNQALFLYHEEKHNDALIRFNEVKCLIPDYKKVDYYIISSSQKIERGKQDDEKRRVKEQIDGLYKKGISFYKNNQLDNAQEAFNEILSLDPSQIKAKFYIKKLLPRKNKKIQFINFQKSQKERKQQQTEIENNKKKQVMELKKEASLLYNQAISLYRKEAYNDALISFNKVKDLTPGYKKVDYYITSSSQRIEVKEQDDEKRRVKEQIDGLYKEGISFYKNNLLDNAEETFNEIISFDPSHAKAKFYIKKLLPQKREKIQIRDQREEQKKFKQQAAELYKQAIILYHKKMYNDALAKFNEVKSLFPGYKKVDYYINLSSIKVEKIQQKKKQQINGALKNNRIDKRDFQENKQEIDLPDFNWLELLPIKKVE